MKKLFCKVILIWMIMHGFSFADQVTLYGQVIPNKLPLGMDSKKIYFHGNSGFWKLMTGYYATLNYQYNLFDVEQLQINSICQVKVNFNDNNFSDGDTYYKDSFDIIATDGNHNPISIRMTQHPLDTISVTNLSNQQCYLITDNQMLMVKAIIDSDDKQFEVYVTMGTE